MPLVFLFSCGKAVTDSNLNSAGQQRQNLQAELTNSYGLTLCNALGKNLAISINGKDVKDPDGDAFIIVRPMKGKVVKPENCYTKNSITISGSSARFEISLAFHIKGRDMKDPEGWETKKPTGFSMTSQIEQQPMLVEKIPAGQHSESYDFGFWYTFVETPNTPIPTPNPNPEDKIVMKNRIGADSEDPQVTGNHSLFHRITTMDSMMFDSMFD